MRLPLIARLYVGVVIALGAAVAGSALVSVDFPRPWLFAALLALSVMSSALKVDLPLGVGSSCISLSYAVDFTALLMLGPGPTILISMTSVWFQCTFRMNQANPAYKTLFSMATLALTVAATGATYRWLGGTYGSLGAAPLQPLMAAAMTYFFVNSVAVATAFALATRRRILSVWHDNFLWSITSYVVGGIAAGIAVEVLHQAGHWQTTLALIPLCLTYRTYRIYLGRIAEERRRVAEWTQLHWESTEVLARAIQAKDNDGSSHVERVQHYASALAARMELSELDTQAVEIAALLHDIGKLAVPEHILSKPGPLTPNERKKMQIHAQVGAEIVSAVPFPCPVAPLIRSHHERWDGKGYPAGLRGEEIPIGARILAVVDCFDALTSERPYRPAVSSDAALGVLHDQAGKAFDPAIVAQFIQLAPYLTPPSDRSSRKIRLSRDGVREAHAVTTSHGQGTDAFAEIASANRESYTLYEIAQVMGQSMSLAETMTLVSSKLSQLVPFSSCALFVREGNERLRCRFAIGMHADLLENGTIREGTGLSGWVARHGRPLINGLPRAEFSAAGISSAETRLQSALVCPLSVNGQVIAMIEVFHEEPGSYTEDHLRVIDEISQHAAAVVHNALVFEQTQEQAFKDSLTGLANPRALQFQVARELGRARRSGSHFSLVLLDLDDFKMINDEYGHLTGDRALQKVAKMLQTTTRPYDMCIRYGGDEFVVLLAGCDRAEAEERRRTFQGAVGTITLESEDGRSIPLRVSAGASVFPEDGDTYERLLARADRRMYKDKAQRKEQLPIGRAEAVPVAAGAGHALVPVGRARNSA
ncbi:MAG TPA: HD domain-containing phosphohydrolase [Vicinamibacterales bacterium]|jgi:diguanylate cyclase (GGDEF)-like protein/putative nucleotidyltransferase with HDIG domain|nr:HD domain-containing phosphohydrolase [Vicinamibacterales bacterium]